MTKTRVSPTVIQFGSTFLLLTTAAVLSLFLNCSVDSVSLCGSDNMAASPQDLLKVLWRTSDRLQRFSSHADFLSACRREGVVPKGMLVRFGRDALPKCDSLQRQVDKILNFASCEILSSCRDTYTNLSSRELSTLHSTLYDLQQNTDFYQFEAILDRLRLSSASFRRKLETKKRNKLLRLKSSRPLAQARPSHPVDPPKKRTNRRFRRVRQPNSTANKNLVVNLSDITLNNDQMKILELGPKFCPTPRQYNQEEYKDDIREGCRLLRLRELHFDKESNEGTKGPPKFYKKTGAQVPTGRDQILDAYCDTLEAQATIYQPPKARDNLSNSERQALRDLQALVKTRTVRISTADKGGAVVVQNCQDYITEAVRLLSSDHYMPVPKDPTFRVARASNVLVEKLYEADAIDQDTRRWALVEPRKVNCHQFYTLPKIHKSADNPPGRPIESGVGGPTENLSKLVDHWLQDAVKALPSYIQDSTHFLRLLNTWNDLYAPFSQSPGLVTIDVTALYTNIPQDELLNAIHLHVNASRSANPKPSTDLILECAKHVLTSNYIHFENQIYHQVVGTAMGTPMAPAAANLFMGMLESKLLSESPVPVHEEFWKRFIDDIFVLWLGTETELQEFERYINSVHPTIKFTVSSSTVEIPFLDVLVRLEDGFLVSDLYTKPTDSHAYLHHRSCHPKHVSKNIPYSQFLRLRRLCTNISDFDSQAERMTAQFLTRGYHLAHVIEARERARMQTRSTALEYCEKETNTRVPFVVTHHPSNPPLRTWLRELQPTLQSSIRMKQAVPDLPVVGERCCKSLRNLLMPSLLPFGPDREGGCGPCQRTKCVICKEHLVQTTTYSSSVTGESFSINNNLSCDSRGVIYMLFCEACHSAQYVGQTGDTLRARFYQYRSDINILPNSSLVTKHFNQAKHSLKQMKVIVMEKVYGHTLKSRLDRETFWIRKMKTLTPHGLNTVEDIKH